MIVVQQLCPLLYRIQNFIVMSALEERDTSTFHARRKQTEPVVSQPRKSLFRVVVNNHKKQEEVPEKPNEEIENMMDDHQGLPPQPTGYLKFPEYDWF